MKSNIIENTNLEGYIKSDLRMLGLPTDFTLDLRGFSKTYYGRYHIREKRVVVYCTDERGQLLPYSAILDTALHEVIHHYQHCHEKGFVRVKGVMHNPTFHKLYSFYKTKLEELGVMECA